MPIIDKTFIKFIIVGLINTAIGSGIMFLLYNVFDAGYWVSSMSNYIIGSIVSFFLNKYFTFSVKEWNVSMIIVFIVNILVSYFIAYGVAKPLMNYLLRNNSQKFRENMALFTGMCIFTGINYLGQRFFVFKKKAGNPESVKEQ